VRVLLLRAGALGDALLLRQAIAALRAARHEPWLITPEGPGRALVGPGGSEVADLVAWDGTDAAALLAGTLMDATLLGQRLAATEAAIVFSRSAEVAEALRRYMPRVLVRDPTPAHGHASVWLADPTRELGAEPAALPPDLVPTAAEIDAAVPWLERLPTGFLAVHPGSGSPAKNWEPSRFLALVEHLSADRPWLLIEGPADEAAAGPLLSHPRAVRARGLSVRVLGAVAARAGLHVGNDSGVSHLAAAFGAPTLALFGPTDPAVWSPVGRRVRAVRSGDGTMSGLSVEAARSAAAVLMADR
jgi:ADP-heptose:LPS heptosyltransferase